MDQLGLTGNERKLISIAKAGERITNKLYQEKFGVTKPTASRHLEALTGKGTHYVLSKGLIKGSKGSQQQKSNWQLRSQTSIMR